MYQGIKTVSFEEAVKVVKSGDRIHIHSVACAPQGLIQALCNRGRAGELRDVKLQHLHTEGSAPYAEAEFEGIFFLESYFVGSNVRKPTQEGYADYVPVHLSETQKLIRSGIHPVDVAMIQVCPPDKHGFVSMGTSVDATLAAVQNAKTVIGVINPNVPRAWGDAIIKLSDIDIFCEDNTPLIEAHPATLTEQDIAIGKNVASLIEDGATLQMGIGAIPNAVLSQLGNHKNLGIHTEMFADGVLPLYEKGVVNNMNKKFDKGKMPTGEQICEKQLFNLVDQIEKVKVNEEEIASLMPSIYRKLEWLDKEDIIKRVVSLEFNRMIDYYKDNDDIEVVDESAPRERGKRGGRGEAEEGYTRFFINFGKTDELTPPQLIELVNKCVPGKVRIGRIDLRDNFSFFEVEEGEANRVMDSMNGFEVDGRRISVEPAQAKGEGGKGSRGSRGGSRSGNGFRDRRDSGRKGRDSRRESDRGDRGGRRSGRGDDKPKRKFYEDAPRGKKKRSK